MICGKMTMGFFLVSESIGINKNREEMLEAMRNDV